MRVETPASHRNDPITSGMAEDHITKTGERDRQQRIVNVLVQMFPHSTSAELARDAERYCLSVAHRVYNHAPSAWEAGHCQLDRAQIARRLSECKTGGHIRHGQRRKCSVTGSSCMTWEPA